MLKVFLLKDCIPSEILKFWIFLTKLIKSFEIFKGLHSIVYSFIQFKVISDLNKSIINFKLFKSKEGFPPPI